MLNAYLLHVRLQGDALLHGLFQAGCRLQAHRRSYELMVERSQLDARLKSGYFPFRRREITTGLVR